MTIKEHFDDSYDPYKALAYAIVTQAVVDFKKATAKLANNRYKYAPLAIRVSFDVMGFLNNEDYVSMLIDMGPKTIRGELKKYAEKLGVLDFYVNKGARF